MLKIYSATTQKEESAKIKQKKRAAFINKKSGDFNIALQNSIEFNFQGAIDELMNDLRQEEKEFLEKQTIYEMNRYKAIVQKILKTILEEGVETRKIGRMRKDRADYLIIDNINVKLMDIAKEITHRENKAFNLLKSIEEIRGLILDLMH